MPEKHTPNPQRLDDELAKFTDRLLDGEMPEMSAPTQDQELFELQQTVVRFKRAFGTGQPDEATASRIRASLVKEWPKTLSGTQAEADSPWQRLQRSLGLHRMVRRQVYAFSLLGLVLAVGILALLFSPDSPGGDILPGAAEGQSGLLPVIVLLGLAGAGVLWWFFRQRRS